MNAAAAITLFVALTVTPLDDAQRAQLSTAGDFDEQFDQGALYPLLHNAATWQPGDEAGAQVPDYASIMQRPADARGGLFLIEGQFAGVPDGQTVAYGPLARPGPWDGKLQWWGVVVEQWSPGVDQPAGDDDNPQAVIAYLVNPPTAADDPPRAGDRVRLVARFYKVWRDVDQNDQTRDYLTFVGHFATLPGGSGSTAPVDRRTPVVRVFEQSRNAVVNISTTQIVQLRDPLGFDLFEQFFHMPRRRTFRRQSVGSGFVLHEAGYIVTNAHVVARTAERKVLFADERAFDAQVVALDHEHDLAVLKIDADGPLATLPLGTSHDLMVGETVIAIGNPLGLSDTVTAGVISAVDRELEFGDGKSFKGLIQTDASINPGNSGGPLLNILGDLIGVNTAMRGDAQNIGFAIPVDQLYKVLPEMLDVERRYGINVGIHVVAFETPDGQRLKIKSIDPDSPAHKSALRDQLVFIDQVDGRPVRTAIDYHIAMIGKRPGDALTLGVRFGKSPPTIVELRIAQRPRPDATVLLRDKFGIVTMPLTHDAARALRVRTDSGLLVTAVESDSPAHDAGVRRGDLLVRLGRHGAARLDELGELLEKVKPGQPIRVAVIRMSGNTTLQLIGEMRARRVNH